MELSPGDKWYRVDFVDGFAISSFVVERQTKDYVWLVVTHRGDREIRKDRAIAVKYRKSDLEGGMTPEAAVSGAVRRLKSENASMRSRIEINEEDIETFKSLLKE